MFATPPSKIHYLKEITGLGKAKTDPSSMGSRWDKTGRSLPFNDENKGPAPSSKATPLKQGANALSESKWAPASIITMGERLATSTQWDLWATSPSETNNPAEVVPKFTVDLALSKKWKEKRDQERAEAVKLARYEVLKTTPATLTAEHGKDQRLIRASVASEASSSKNLSGTEDMETDFPALPSQPVATNSRALADVEFDDDGDVVMADLEEWRDIEEVAHVIAEDRANERIGQGKVS